MKQLSRRKVLQSTSLAAAGLALGIPRHTFARVGAPLLVHSQSPPNAEPRLPDLIKSWKTANELFYVRSHADAPKLAPKDFKVSVGGMVRRPISMTAAALKDRFKQYTVDATLTCAGNRRTEHSAIKKVGGVPWMAGAIGNATWGGIALSELLRLVEPTAEAKYVWFEGADEIEKNSTIIPFGASIPIEKAMAMHGQIPGALVVYDMNGQPLTADHGFPLRTVVPGYIGARSVKWLRKIVLSDQPSPNHYVAKAYKVVTESTPEQWSGADPILEYRTNGVICTPQVGDKLSGKTRVSGYALAGGEPQNSIAKVELSTDGGSKWSMAKMQDQARPFCWQRWMADIAIPGGCKEIVVRVTDSSGYSQPENLEWNLKGYLCNSWHRVAISGK